jgi:hypothetical protein
VNTFILIYTPQETLCILVCIPESSFIKSPVIIIILLKGAHTNAFIFVLAWGVGSSKLREGKMQKLCKYNIHPRKWTMPAEQTYKFIYDSKLLSVTFTSALHCNEFGTIQKYITQLLDHS